MRRISALLALLIFGLTACGQSMNLSGAIALANPTPLPTTTTAAISDTASFAEALRASGAVVSEEGEVSLAFLHTNGTLLHVDDQRVQVYQYAADEDARADAARFSHDGASVSSDIGVTLVNWFATPHLYRVPHLIAVYIGDQSAMLSLLENILGAQFAGGANPYHAARSES